MVEHAVQGSLLSAGMRHTPVIAVMSESSDVSYSDLRDMVEAMQEGVTHDFAPFWGRNASLRAIPRGHKPPAGAWWLTFLENSDQQDALGYHDVTPEGLPIGKVFTKSTLANGGVISVTADHELKEMLADPTINICALDDTTARLYALEVADPVEADDDGYTRNGVRLSNFILPTYFEAFQSGRKGVNFDFLGQLLQPMSLRPGGYISYLDLNKASKGWQQEFAQSARARFHRERPVVGSRRERRRIPRDQWVKSKDSPTRT